MVTLATMVLITIVTLFIVTLVIAVGVTIIIGLVQHTYTCIQAYMHNM